MSLTAWSQPPDGGLEAPVDSSAAAEAPAPGAIVTRFEAQIEMDRLAQEKKYAEAEEVGNQLIPLTVAEFGLTSVETAHAYESLGRIQSAAGNYETAETNLLQAVNIYRDTSGVYSELLIDPLLALGDNYHAAGEYSNAISSYTEARTVSRRVYGLHNEGQVEMLDRMTESYERLDDIVNAQQQQLEALRIAERSYDTAAPELYDAIYKYAAWLRGVHHYEEEREQYLRVERLIKDAHGNDSELLVRVLREEAASYRIQGNAASVGISSLKDALAILESVPDPNPLLLAEVLRDIGDWNTAFSRVGTLDNTDYVRSWETLSAVSNGEELRKEWYAGIEFVFNAPLSRRYLSNDSAAPRGRVLVRFDIDPFGASENIAIVASEPAGLKDEAVLRYIAQSRFRPNIVNGQVVTASNQMLDIVFRYELDEPPP